MADFFNLLALAPIRTDSERTMLMGCQFAFRRTQTGGTLRRTSGMIEEAQRQMRMGAGNGLHNVNIHDTSRRNTIAMRFEVAFTRVKNTVVKNNNRILHYGSTHERASAILPGGFAGRDQTHVAKLLG